VAYAAIVLAGGGARRLGGVHKPALRVGGVSLLARVLAAVPDAVPRVVVGPPQPVPPDVLLVRERPPGGGPVAALAAGLAALPGVPAEVALLAADLPFLTVASIRILRDAAGGADGAVYVDPAGRRQLLCGVWRVSALRAALGVVEPAGARLRDALARLRVVEVEAAGDGPPPWYDCDTEADLRTARARAARRGPAEAAPGLERTARARAARGGKGGGMATLDEWVGTACEALGLDPATVDRDLILDLARDVAHGVARPAAPLTTYLLGVAVGRGADAREAAARLAALAAAAAPRDPR